MSLRPPKILRLSTKPKSIHVRYGVITSAGWLAGHGTYADSSGDARLYLTLKRANEAASAVKARDDMTATVKPFQVCEI